MWTYREAVRQLRENGYVTETIRNHLSPAEMLRAIEEASAPA